MLSFTTYKHLYNIIENDFNHKQLNSVHCRVFVSMHFLHAKDTGELLSDSVIFIRPVTLWIYCFINIIIKMSPNRISEDYGKQIM